jgi:hypothetical protein
MPAWNLQQSWLIPRFWTGWSWLSFSFYLSLGAWPFDCLGLRSSLPMFESLIGVSEHPYNIVLTMNCIGHRVTVWVRFDIGFWFVSGHSRNELGIPFPFSICSKVFLGIFSHRLLNGL